MKEVGHSKANGGTYLVGEKLHGEDFEESYAEVQEWSFVFPPFIAVWGVVIPRS